MGRVLSLTAALLLAACIVSSALADVPTSMNVQGRLLDAAGDPLPPGAKDFSFRILNGDGKQLWPGSGYEDHIIVTGDGGLWNALVGTILPIPPSMFADSSLWLEITVDDHANPVVTFPPVRFATGPYAFRAAWSGVADSALNFAGDGAFLPLSGGAMTGPITNTGDPSITMGKGNFGTSNTNPGIAAFVAGHHNDATGDYATISGGEYSDADAEHATVGGGSHNHTYNVYSTISGGYSSVAHGPFSTIGGGVVNFTDEEATGAAIGGGGSNRAWGEYSVIAGGGGGSQSDTNSVRGMRSSIGGGYRNSVSGDFGVIGGGDSNRVYGLNSVVSGGHNNEASFPYSTVGGGSGNYAGAHHSVIAGGTLNQTSDVEATVSGGRENHASNVDATIGGGAFNVASGAGATVSGGSTNSAWSSYSSIGGGLFNVAASHSVVGGGRNNKAKGAYSVISGGGGREADGDSNIALGVGSVVPGGRRNFANGDFSFAAGFSAKAEHYGSFVWADSSTGDFSSEAPNQFMVRASGGTGFGTTLIGGGTVLEIADEFDPTHVEMVRIQSTHDPGVNNDILTLEVPSDAPDNCQFIEAERGSDVKFRLNGNGDVTADGTVSGGGADLAEMVAVSGGVHSAAPGDVMVIDPNNPRALAQSATARSTLVAGIYSTAPGFVASPHNWDQIAVERGLAAKSDADHEDTTPPLIDLAAAIGEIPLAVVGIVPCRVSAENGAIRAGDLLVTASTPGHAMRDDAPKPGTILGKALGELNAGTGTIEVLVTLQ
jgi:hypothetical protein